MILPFLGIVLPLSWGVGNLTRSIGERFGWNPKRVFWVSSITYGALITGAIISSNESGSSSPVCNGLLILGVVSIFLKLVSSKSLVLSTSGATYRKSLASNNGADINSIFISYRRSDSTDIAGRLYDRLADDFGREAVFKDVDSIPLGLDFKEYLNEQVGKCDVLLAVIGDRWLDASDANGNKRLEDPYDFVRIEIESALDKNIPVIPLLVRGASMPNEESLPSSLRKLVFMNGIPIRPDPDFHRDMDRLIKALEEYV